MVNASFKKLKWPLIGLLVAIVGWVAISFLGSSPDSPFAPVASRLPQLPFVGVLREPTTVLFMGTDIVYSGQGRGLQADHVALNGRSDTMLLAFLNPAHNTISVLHIPRDTQAYVGKYGVQKINSANALGGPDLAKATVAGLLNVPVEHYVVMNIDALVQLVNEMGGVTLDVPKKMSYMDWTGKLKIDLTPGVHTLTGNQAMGFVRFRHDALGDIGRVQRQQIFLNAVARQMLNPKTWPHIPNLMNIAMKNIQTDLTQAQMFEMLNFGRAVPKKNIKFVMLPGQFSPDGNWEANTDGRMIAAQLANPDQQSVWSRKNISITIINASPDKQLGSKLATALRALGYRTCVGADEPEPEKHQTRIIAQNGNDANADMLKNDLGVGQVVNASIGDLLSSLTIVAHEDIVIDSIRLSSVDAPYIAPISSPQPLVDRPVYARRPRQTNEAGPLEVVPIDPNATSTDGTGGTNPDGTPMDASGERNGDNGDSSPVPGTSSGNPGSSGSNSSGSNSNSTPDREPAREETRETGGEGRESTKEPTKEPERESNRGLNRELTRETPATVPSTPNEN